MRDPNPGSADGAKRLRDAGIRVEFAHDPEPFAALNEGWLKRVAVGIPFVTAKLALSLDAHGAFRRGRARRHHGRFRCRGHSAACDRPPTPCSCRLRR